MPGTDPEPSWRITLAGPAVRDLREILRWTAGRFGRLQADRYGAAVEAGLLRLRHGPDVAGATKVGPAHPGLLRLRMGARHRHSFYLRVAGPHRLEVLRILHDSMDPDRHLPEAPD